MESVLDMGSRRIVGFAISEHHDTDCAYGALSLQPDPDSALHMNSPIDYELRHP